MSNTRSSRLRLRSENGVTTGQYSTQISKFFPKASTSTQPVDCELLPRKRKAPPIETITSDPLVTAEVTPKKIPKKSTPREPPTITKFFQFNDDNSSDEFETPRKPQPIARAPPPKKAPTKKSKIKPKKGANKNSIVSKFFSNDGIDPEHLQMALALSRSVEQTSGPCENTETAEETMSTQEKRVAVKNMFQKFGFKAPASRDFNPNSWLGLPKKSRKLKWAKRFTALTKRNAAIEVKKTKAKTQLVLRKFGEELTFSDSINACTTFQISSEFLGQLYMHDKMLFRLHGAVDKASVEEFYTNNLLQVSTAKCGCLLKDWRTIPGRDGTPERENIEGNALTHSKVSHSNGKCDENEKADDKNIGSDEKNESASADSVLLNPQAIKSPVKNITSKTLSQSRPIFRGRSPDIFDDSDEEQPMDKTMLAPETPPQSIELNEFIDIATCPETVASKTSIPSSSETLTSNQQDDDMSDISEEVTPPWQIRTKQDEEEERVLKLYTIGHVDDKLHAELEHYSKSQSSIASTVAALEASVIVNPNFLPVDLKKKSPDCNEEVISLSGAFIKQTQTGVMVFEEFTSDDAKTDEVAVPIMRASTPQKQKPPQTEIIEIFDDSSPESSPIKKNASNRSNFEVCSESIDPYIAELQKSLYLDDHPVAAVVTSTISSPIHKLSLKNFDEPAFSDDIEFSFKSIASNDAPNSQIDNILSQADSFVISDDEINYSMKKSNPKRASSSTLDDEQPCGSKDHEPVDLEFSRYIFDDDDDPFMETSNRYDADAAIEMMERSIRDIVEKDFVTNATKSATKFTRTKSDVPNGLHKHQQSASKLRRFMDDSFVMPRTQNMENDEIDEFDQLVHGHIVASSFLSPTRTELISDRIDLTESPEADRNEPSAVIEREFEVRNGAQVYHVKFGPSVTPKPNYESMDTPTRLIELRRYGLKALSKRKAIICLEHIFNRMHPFIEDRNVHVKDQANSRISVQTINGPDPPKEPLLSDSSDEFFDLEPLEVRPNLASQDSDNDDDPLLTQAVDMELGPLYTQPIAKSMNLQGTSIASNVQHMFVPFFAEQTQYFLPSPPRKNCFWCLQPLHVAWYNLLQANPHVFELILQYTPIDLNEIRNGFKALGLLYAVNDLIAFFDKHCITYRMENQHNKKKKV